MQTSTERQWSFLLPIAIVVGVVSGVFSAYGVFFTPLQNEFHAGSASTASIFSLSMACFLITQFIGGRVADVYSPLLVVGTGITLFAGGLMGMSLARSLWHVYLSYGIIAGSGLGCIWTPCLALVSKRYEERRRGWAVGAIVTANSICVALMAPAARVLVDHFGWRVGYLVLGAAFGIITWGSFLFMWRTSVRDSAGATVAGPAVAVPVNAEGSWTLAQALRTAHFWLLVLSDATWGFGSSIILVHLVPYALNAGVSPLMAATALTAFGFARVPFSFGLGYVADRWNRRWLQAGCSLLLTAAVFGLVRFGAGSFLYPVAIVFALSWSAGVLLYPVITTDVFGVANVGAVFGIVHGGYTVGNVAGPVIAGLMEDRTGRYGLAMEAALIALAVSAVGLFFIRRRPAPASAPFAEASEA